MRAREAARRALPGTPERKLRDQLNARGNAVLDTVLDDYAHALAELQRLRMDELDLTGRKARIVGRIVDLIDPQVSGRTTVHDDSEAESNK